MSLRGWNQFVACALVTTWCALALVSCGHSPTAPSHQAILGRLLVYVSQNGMAASPGKTIEILDTSLRQTTDAHGMALFSLPAGSHVVRAYDLGTPGPGRPFVEQSVEVQSGRTSRVEFNDCTMCR